jgi:hypothetical protein
VFSWWRIAKARRESTKALRLFLTRHEPRPLGLHNAHTVVAHLMNLRPILDDPNVVAATKLANSLSITGAVNRDDIGGALIHMLFQDVATPRGE